jgi:hypothetical protein
MPIALERAIHDDVRDILHFLPPGFDRERLLGPRQIVTVLMARGEHDGAREEVDTGMRGG